MTKGTLVTMFAPKKNSTTAGSCSTIERGGLVFIGRQLTADFA